VAWGGLFAGVVGNVTGKPLLRWPSWLSFRNHRLRLLVLAAGLLALLAVLPLELRVGGELEIAPARNTDVRAQVGGIIEAVYKEEGDVVAAGDTLARLSDRELHVRKRMVETDLEERRARFRLLQAGPRAEELKVGRLAVAKSEQRLRYAKTELERARRLAASEAASRQELDRAEEQVSVQTAELEGERARLQVLLAGSRPEEIAAMQEEIAHSEAELEHVESELARVWVTAAHGGTVTTPKLRERIGEYVKPGDLIAEVHALQTVTAEISLPEQDVGEVQVGRRGVVRLRAYPERAFEGRVVAIAPAAVEIPGMRGRIVKATIELANPQGLLKPAMTGYARIACGRRSALDLLTRGLRRFIRLEFWSWW
jgi:multidrug resistance efflux pump